MTLTAEVFEIFSAVDDRRVAGRERSGRNCRGAPIERLGIADPSGSLGDDCEIVQRAREIWMDRTKLGFLNPGSGLSNSSAAPGSPAIAARSACSIRC